MLTPALTIQRKRDGKELTSEQIHHFIGGLARGDVTDYQATAFLMATYFRGMNLAETVALTEAMLESGDRYDLSDIPGAKVDKHSTGGVGDKVSLILAPLAAACGLKVPMMAGRGLGHSGGTIDKLEAISGFNVNLTPEKFRQVLSSVGVAIIGQSARIAPADGKLYALRDVTATVECIPLIVASILSKKLAEGTEALVLDVKLGSGAFMKSREQARKLAKVIIQVARKMGIKCRALITDMNQPLGYAAGNSLEVLECIEILRNERFNILPEAADLTSCDLKELTIQLSAQMLHLGGVARNITEGRKLSHARLADGSAWKKFEQMVQAQGGSIDQIRNPRQLPIAKTTYTWKAKKSGYLSKMNTESIGRILVELGGGRKRAADPVDFGVGFIFHKKLGAKVSSGDTIATVYASGDPAALEPTFQEAIEISGTRKPVAKLILEVVE